MVRTFFRYCSFFPWSVYFASFYLLASPASSTIHDTSSQLACKRTDSSLALILCILSSFFINRHFSFYVTVSLLFITYFFIVVIMAKNSEIQQLYSQDFTRRYPAPVNQYNIITTIDAFFSEFDPSQIPVIRNNNYCMDQI